MLPEISDWEHHKASAGPGGSRIVDTSRVGMHTAPVVWRTHPTLQTTQKAGKKLRPAIMAELEGESPQPHVPVVMGKAPQPHMDWQSCRQAAHMCRGAL